MTKEFLRKTVIEVFYMDRSDLEAFEKKLSISDVDDEARGFLDKAIETVKDANGEITHSVEAVSSDTENDIGTKYD